jgi:hypothetical protein
VVSHRGTMADAKAIQMVCATVRQACRRTAMAVWKVWE